VDFRLGLEVWYQEPRFTCDPELEALSLCMDLYTLQAVCKQNGWQRLRDFPTNQNNASIPVLNLRQDPNRARPQRELYEIRLGAQEQRYMTDFFLQRQTKHAALPQCMLGMLVVLVHDRRSEYP